MNTACATGGTPWGEPVDPLEMEDMFYDDYLHPVQYAGLKRNPYARGWVHRLCVAVLRDAVDCLLAPTGGVGAKSAQQRARMWIERTDNWGVFSFESICSILDINSMWLRRALLDRYQHQAQKGVSYVRSREPY